MSHEFSRPRAVRALTIPAAAIGLLLVLYSAAFAIQPDAAALAAVYKAEVRPLMEHYCHDCHGAADVTEGDINLAAMKTWGEVAKHPKTWQKVAEMLGNGLMPPQDAEQPTKAERAKLQKWVADDLALEAQAHAGDPGRVVLRRLSNAEF